MKKTKERRKNDIERYKMYYGVNPFEKEHYDPVIDTSNKTKEEVLNIVLKTLENY